MAITDRVQGSFFDNDSDSSDDARLIRLPPNAPPSKGPTRRQGRPWTNDEHDRFLHAMELFPSGPWKDISAHVGTRTTRQTMTHAQKYRQKIARWKRGASTAQPMVASHTATSMIGSKSASTPLSPQAAHEIELAVDEANEDSMFWRIVQDILDVEVDESEQWGGSMVGLLNECQYV